MNKYTKINKRTLGENLKEARVRRGLLQSDVAQALHLERSTYTSYEIGRTSPSPETLFRLSEIFNTPVSILLSGDFPPFTVSDSHSAPYFPGVTAPPLVHRLQPDERELLTRYKKLTAEQKAHLLDVTRQMEEEFENEKAQESGQTDKEDNETEGSPRND